MSLEKKKFAQIWKSKAVITKVTYKVKQFSKSANLESIISIYFGGADNV